MITYVAADPHEYQPGVCNIGPAEIERRRRIGYIGLVSSVLLGAALLAFGAPAWTRLAVAMPVAVALSGLIQAQLRFCAGYGLAGLQNMGALGQQMRIGERAARAADRRKALLIHGMAFAGGLVAGLVFALLPF